MRELLPTTRSLETDLGCLFVIAHDFLDTDLIDVTAAELPNKGVSKSCITPSGVTLRFGQGTFGYLLQASGPKEQNEKYNTTQGSVQWNNDSAISASIRLQQIRSDGQQREIPLVEVKDQYSVVSNLIRTLVHDAATITLPPR